MTYFANGHFAKSDDAGFIMVSGTESIDFLQSILTANVATIAMWWLSASRAFNAAGPHLD